MNHTNPKLIFLDLDGTLLNGEHLLTPTTIAHIKDISVQFNLKFVLASGRAPKAMLHLYHALGLTTPLITLNGALVITHSSLQQYLLNHTFKLSDILTIQNLCQSELTSINYFCQQDWFCEHKNKYVLLEEWQNKTKVTEKSNSWLKQFWSKNNRYPNKIELFSEGTVLDRIEKILRNMIDRNFDLIRSAGNCLEINSVKSNKAVGAKVVMDYYNVSREKVWAFGDAENDAEILAPAHRGILMKNSKFKNSIAHDLVTDFSNLEDGVIKHLNRHLVIQEI